MAMTLGDIIVNVKSDTSQLVKGFNRAENTVTKASKNMTNAIKVLTAGYIGLNAVDLVRTLGRQADEMTNVNSKLKLVTKSTEELTRTQKALFDISQKTRSSFTNNVDLYQKISFSTKELNLTQQKQLLLTEQINKELLISGTTAAGAATLITQLGQAFSSNFKAVSQEINTLKDQAPSLYQAILAGTGRTAAEFKKMAEQGELSSEMIINAIIKQKDETDSNFAQIATTIDKAYGNVINSTQRIIGRFDELIGASESVSKSITNISESIDEIDPNQIEEVARQIEVTAIAIGGTVLAYKSYNTAIAISTAYTATFGGALGGVNRAIVLSTISTKALSSVMKTIPIVAVASGIALIADSLFDSAKASDELEESLSKTGKKLSELTKNQLEYRKVVLDEALHDAYMERQKAVVDAAHQGFLESDKEHALDLKNKDEAIAKFREIRKAVLDVNKAISGLNKPTKEIIAPSSKQAPSTKEELADQKTIYENGRKFIFQLNQESIEKDKERLEEKLVVEKETQESINELQQMGFELSKKAQEEQQNLISNALDSMTTPQEKMLENFLEMEEVVKGVFDTEQMEKFYKAQGDLISKSGKEQEKSNKNTSNLQDIYSNITGLMSNFYDEDDKRKKKQQQLNQAINIAMQVQNTAFLIAEEIKALASAKTAVAIAAQSSPWTGFATATAMIGLMGSLGIAISGGGSSGVSTEGQDVNAARLEQIELTNEPIIAELQRQTDLLESIDLSGSAGAVNIQRALADFVKSNELIINETEALKSKGGMIVTLSTEGSTAIQDLVNVIRMVEEQRERQANGDIFSFSTLGIVFETGIGDGLDNFNKFVSDVQQSITDFSLSMVGVVSEMSSASDKFKDIFDNITQTTRFADEELTQAFADFDSLKQNNSYAEYLESQINIITAVENEFSRNIQELLLSTSVNDIQAQTQAVLALQIATGKAFENGVKDALDFVDSIELVGEALVSSIENINTWTQRNDTAEDIAMRLADTIGVNLATSMQGLDNLANLLIATNGVLTDSELNLLQANEDLLKSNDDLIASGLRDYLNDVTSDISSLRNVLSSLGGVINKLQTATLGTDFSLNKFFDSMSKTLELSKSGDTDEFTRSLSETIGASSILFNADAFEFERDRLFAQQVAINQFEALEETTLTEIDVLRQIEENTRDQIDAILLLISGLGDRIDSSLLGEGDLTPKQEQWVNQDSGDTTWTSSGGAIASGQAGSQDFTIATKTGETYSSEEARDFVNEALDANAPEAVYNKALTTGISANSLDALMGWELGTSNKWATSQNLPSFAVGTPYVPNDMTANIHKGEIIVPEMFSNGLRNGDLIMGESSTISSLLNTVISVLQNQNRLVDEVKDIQNETLVKITQIEEAS